MRIRNRFYFIVSFSCCLLTVISAANSNEKLASIEGRHFEIIGTDMRSVSFTNALGEHVAVILNRCLSAGSCDFPEPVTVILQPKKDVEYEEDYRIKSGDRGHVSLYLCWDASLKLETLCRALTEAYIVRCAIFNHGPSAEQKIRFWAVSALASWSYLNLRPAQKAVYMIEAKEHGISEIATLLGLDLESGSQEKHLLRQGYWILHTLRQNGLGYSNISAMLDDAIMGVDVTPKLKRIVASSYNEEDSKFSLEGWWQDQIKITLLQDREYCDSLDASRTWIEELANFDNYTDLGVELNNLMELWKYRNNQALRSTLEARREIIRLRIERVNPAYFNVALSLGILFENALEAEHKYEFIHALAVYSSDWSDTKQLHEKAFELLSEISNTN